VPLYACDNVDKFGPLLIILSRRNNTKFIFVFGARLQNRLVCITYYFASSIRCRTTLGNAVAYDSAAISEVKQIGGSRKSKIGTKFSVVQ